jgi:GT2 family glycosyltransferase
VLNQFAAVVIGRNEGAKLRRCLASVLGVASRVIFVDSGSEDGSADLARTAGVDVVELDRSAPFGVARARNAGLVRAVELCPDVELIQFVDADSEMIPAWFGRAGSALAAHPDLAVVFGRVREREPRRSIYHRLYQAEFDVQTRRPETCGGMAMMRVRALGELGGFNAALLGFEDVDLSLRLRRSGWRVEWLEADMAVHEARMQRFADWWRRESRGGYAWAQTAALHGISPQRHGLRQCRSAWFWGLVLPLLVVITAVPTHGMSVGLLGAYPALFIRVYRRWQRCGPAGMDAALYAAACVLGKFPQAVGQLHYSAEHRHPWWGLRRLRHC